jgi:hypothetical protein
VTGSNDPGQTARRTGYSSLVAGPGDAGQRDEGDAA